MNGKKCPACGSVLEATAAVCSSCGLGELNRIFLSRMERERWVRQVLEPHKRTLTPRVFAGARHILILTGSGALYGLGWNTAEQICADGSDKYETPQLVATNVIDAAAGCDYTIYITRDGQVHLQGRGIYAERFPGFSGAKQVFAGQDKNQFWIVDNQGKQYFFGDNTNLNRVIALKRRLLVELPESVCTINFSREQRTIRNGTYGTSTYYHTWDTVYQETDEIKERVKRSDRYRQEGKRHGYENIELELALNYCTVLDGKQKSDPNRRELRKYVPEIFLCNNQIFVPEELPNQDLDLTAHRRGSKPMELPEVYTENTSGIKKACAHSGGYLFLHEDGTTELVNYSKRMNPEWNGQKAVDVALGIYGVVVYKNGDVVLFPTHYQPDWQTDKRLVRLPKSKQP